jgi:hypothetical protein
VLKELKYLNIDLLKPVDIPRITYNELFAILEKEGELRLHARYVSNMA